MVAINGRDVLSRALNLVRTNYHYYIFGKSGEPTIPSHPTSSVHSKKATANGPAPKRRKQDRVERKRCNHLARSNSAVMIPGSVPKDRKSQALARHNSTATKPSRSPKDRKSQAEPPAQEQRGKRPDLNQAKKEEELIRTELDSLMFDKSIREEWFKVTAISERVKAGAVERRARLDGETKKAEKPGEAQELERREEKERSVKWKDKRLAELETKAKLAQSELDREKLKREHSRLKRVFQEQERRHKDEERWKQAREKEAKLAADRERNLQLENAILQKTLESKEIDVKRACAERDYVKQKRESDKAARLRAEENLLRFTEGLNRWDELIKEHFGGQQPQDNPDEPQETPQPQPQPELSQSQSERLQLEQPLQVEQSRFQFELPQLQLQQPRLQRKQDQQAQFLLYEKRWQYIRSGINADGSADVLPVSFSQIPWPVIDVIPTHPGQLLPEHIKAFVMHPRRLRPGRQGLRLSMSQRATEELSKWTCDQFNLIVLSKVREEDRAATAEAAGIVVAALTSMLR